MHRSIKTSSTSSSFGSSNASTSSRYEIVEPRASHPSDGSGERPIGEGAYGVVYKARDTVTDRFVALKKIKIENETDGISSSTLREITLLMQLNHDNIVKLENVTFERERMCLIFELLEVDLRRYLDQVQGLLPEDVVRVSTFLCFTILVLIFDCHYYQQRNSVICSAAT
jgi:hypothetical protein